MEKPIKFLDMNDNCSLCLVAGLESDNLCNL